MSTPVELISFKLCPELQRLIILLLEKDQEFRVTFISQDNPPDWFCYLSPLKKMPVMRMREDVLVESTIIADYLDATIAPSLYSPDPLQKAKQRALVLLCRDILKINAGMLTAESEEAFQNFRNQARAHMEHLEKSINPAPYVGGEQFSMVDAAFAPMFVRYAVIMNKTNMKPMAQTPKIRTWAQALLARESVKKSILKDFSDLYMHWIVEQESFLSQKLRDMMP